MEQIPVIIEKPAHRFDAPTKWLLLITLCLGIAFRALWECGDIWAYSAFWAAYAVVFVIWQWGRAKKNVWAWFVLAAAVLLMFLLPRQAKLDYLDGLILLMLLTLPMTLMLHAVIVMRDVPLQREGMLVKGVLQGFFILPFVSIGRWFGALHAVFGGRDGKRSATVRAILAGLLVGIPLMLIVLSLLRGADAHMDDLLHTFFEELSLSGAVSWIAVSLIAAVLLYSFFYASRYALPKLEPIGDRAWNPASLAVIEVLLLAVYALFLGLQFSYLFGGTLPTEYTYAEYARAGFAELIAVSVINFTVLALSVRYGVRNRLLILCEWILLLSTALLLVSAMTRLLMYIGAYGLTMMRILPLWLMVYLAALTVMTAIRFVKKDLPLVRIMGTAFLFWYAALHIPDWYSIITAYNK